MCWVQGMTPADEIHAGGKDGQRTLLNQINAELREATRRLVVTEEWPSHGGEPSVGTARGVCIPVLDTADHHVRGNQHGKLFIGKKGGWPKPRENVHGCQCAWFIHHRQVCERVD